MPSKKNFIWKEKFLSGGGEGVRKKGQISLVKEQKKEGIDIRGGGGHDKISLFLFQ